jgi:hypothetical protein
MLAEEIPIHFLNLSHILTLCLCMTEHYLWVIQTSHLAKILSPSVGYILHNTNYQVLHIKMFIKEWCHHSSTVCTGFISKKGHVNCTVKILAISGDHSWKSQNFLWWIAKYLNSSALPSCSKCHKSARCPVFNRHTKNPNRTQSRTWYIKTVPVFLVSHSSRCTGLSSFMLYIMYHCNFLPILNLHCNILMQN